MTINRKFWLNHFFKNNFPNWNCPRCDVGILRPVDKSFQSWESADSHEFGRKYLMENHQSFDDNTMLGMEASEYRYSVLLKCNSCSEFVASCGSGCVIQDYVPELGERDFFDVFSSKYFYPAINIFSISPKCPKVVETEIKLSFKLFFSDPAAAANYIRKAVDTILTERRINRFTTNSKGKQQRIKLHDRIVLFQSQ